jgi:L-ascorbate metabolism protein UlaG (beta-lactamase superfamily)
MILMELKWLGHASWLIKTGGKNIFLDPYEGDYSEKADIILSTHHHDDHCKPDKIALIKSEKTEIVATKECGEKIKSKVTSLKPGELTKIDNVVIEAIEAYNFKRFRSPGTPFHPKGIGVGYLVKAEGKTIYHAGDTDFIEEMKKLKDIDVMLVPSGGTYTMDNSEAAVATITVNPRKAMPMHIWDTNPSDFKKTVEEKCDTEVIIMKPGESLKL